MKDIYLFLYVFASVICFYGAMVFILRIILETMTDIWLEDLVREINERCRG